jgi:hypothetical protein
MPFEKQYAGSEGRWRIQSGRFTDEAADRTTTHHITTFDIIQPITATRTPLPDAKPNPLDGVSRVSLGPVTPKYVRALGTICFF